MLNKHEIRKTVQKALIFSLTCLCAVFVYAAVNYFFRSSHSLIPETANVQLNESYVEDGLYVYGSDTLPYNTTVINNSNTDVYVFVEFDSPVIGGSTVLTPVVASGWELYDEGSGTVEEQSVYKYIFAYRSGGTMTALSSGVETGNVFSSVAVNTGLTEAQYGDLGSYPFHVTVRTAVASASDGNAGTVWTQVPAGY